MDKSVRECSGPSEAIQECILGGCPFWATWGAWTSCSVTCGDNVQKTRARRCMNEKTGMCPGDRIEATRCEVPRCPIWSSWASWTECSKPCGYGSTSKDRKCINGNPRADCPGIEVENKPCQKDICAVWTSWSSIGRIRTGENFNLKINKY